jgi:hypothetical protein
MSGRTNVTFSPEVGQMSGRTNVEVGQMSLFSLWSDKCQVGQMSGRTNVEVGQMSCLCIGRTNVAFLALGRTNVDVF